MENQREAMFLQIAHQDRNPVNLRGKEEKVMENLMARLVEFGTLYGAKILGALVIFVVGRWIASMLKRSLTLVLRKTKVDETLIRFLSNITYAALLILVVISALGSLGIKTASFVAVIGAAGLAAGLALQGSLSNFGAGVLLLLLNFFKVGDYVEAAGAKGVVEEIGISHTTLKSPENKRVIVPNSRIIGGNIVLQEEQEPPQ